MDGVDHINVYSKGQTVLGRRLSNFACAPFELDSKRFASVEAWWYWRQLPRDDPGLRALYGWQAKSFGGSMIHNCRKPDPTPDELIRVYRAKLDAHPALLAEVKASTLPFDYYYVYNGVRRDTPHRWTGQLWNRVRDELKAA